MKNNKGFTLIELLAVIVILAILLAIAIPQVNKYITNSRKESLITTAKDFIDAVKKDATSEIYDFPISTNDVTIVSTSLIKLNKGGTKSSFGGNWVDGDSYVAIINIGTDIDPEYKYYIALADSKRYTIALTAEDKLDVDSIVRNNVRKTKVAVTSMCGIEDGKYMVLNKIVGLEDYQTKYGWNVTVYGDGEC